MDEVMLLKMLANNPTISVSDLADILQESEDKVTEEKKRLEDEKVICGYHTVINWEKTNTDHCSAIIEVSAKPERDVGYDRIAERIARFEEVSSLYLMSGKSEFIVILEGRTMREVSDFVAQKLAPIEGVTSTVTCFILKKYKMEGHLLEIEHLEDERQIIHE